MSLFVFFFISCDFGDKKLMILNNTNDTIFFSVSRDTVIKKYDKPLYYIDPNNKYINENCLMPNENERCSMINTRWEDFINNEIPDKKLKIIFMTKKLLDNVKCEDVVKNQYYSRRLEFTVEELKKLNWKVVYSDSIDLNVGFNVK